MRKNMLAAAVLMALPGAWAQEPQQTAAADRLAFDVTFARDVQETDIEALAAGLKLSLAAEPGLVKRGTALPALVTAAEQALRADQNNIAWLYAVRLMAVVAGVESKEEADVCAAYNFVLDRRVANPSGLVYARVEPLFKPARLAAGARFVIEVIDASGRVLSTSNSHEANGETVEVALGTLELMPGSYAARFRLMNGAGKALVEGRRAFSIDSGWRERADRLGQAARRFVLDDTIQRSERARAAARFVQWTSDAMFAYAAGEVVGGVREPHPVIETWAHARMERMWSEPLSVGDVERAERYAEDLAAGRDPLLRERDHRLAFQSRADQSLRTYRLYLPAAAVEDKPAGLVMLMHGFGGDETSWPDRLPGAGEVLRKMSDRYHLVVVAAAARSRYSRFMGADLADVEQLKAIAGEIQTVDEKRTVLVGHGPAAFSAVTAALADPKRWPAGVAVAGLPSTVPEAGEGEQPRLMFFYGGKDRLFGVAEARRWALLLSKRLARFEAVELESAGNAEAAAVGLERAAAAIFGEAAK